jgi:hypothetical protein
MGAQSSRSHWLAFASVVVAALTIAGSDQAQARAKSKRDARPRAIHGPSYHPPYAAIVIDDKSGAVLHEVGPDEPRHPASLTKIMTLYLLFEQLEAGTLKLDTALPVSTRASLQNPTKLGLKPNQTIKVEEAILGLVTKSANDAAVVVAEAISGSEEEFAARMTRKARALGMSGTTYVNASGLPAEAQITTARDQAVLGRAIQHRFPVYYQYFSTLSFRYKGAEMRNHNHLLGAPRRQAHRRGRAGRHLERRARRPHAAVDRTAHHPCRAGAHRAGRRGDQRRHRRGEPARARRCSGAVQTECDGRGRRGRGRGQSRPRPHSQAAGRGGDDWSEWLKAGGKHQNADGRDAAHGQSIGIEHASGRLYVKSKPNAQSRPQAGLFLVLTAAAASGAARGGLTARE